MISHIIAAVGGASQRSEFCFMALYLFMVHAFDLSGGIGFVDATSTVSRECV
jgi:hypothetical protein